MKDLKNVRLFLLDMDGTLYLDDELFDGTLDFLQYLRDTGKQYLFLTNNSSKGVDCYVEKLHRLGIPATSEDFLTSVHVTVSALQKKKYRRIYALGTASFREQLRQGGLPITDRVEEEVDCLCMGFDTELTFQKLEDACILLGRDVDYIATNPDWVCPTSYGYVPDCGSVSEMLFRATGRRPLFLGKPAPEMAYFAMEKTGVTPEETAIVGDRLYTDIACGKNAGITTVFVLSGEGTRKDAEEGPTHPDVVLPHVRALLNVLQG